MKKELLNSAEIKSNTKLRKLIKEFLESDEDVPIIPCLAATAAPHGDIYIVFEPGGERDVPTPPEVGYAIREIRTSEILCEFEPQNLAHSYGHERISPEISINLDGIENAGDETGRPAKI